MMNRYNITLWSKNSEPWKVQVEAHNVSEAIDIATRYYQREDEREVVRSRAIPIPQFRVQK